MTACLFLHIGPPKTATTAFQLAMQVESTDKLVYGGVRQPRSSNQFELSTLLHQICSVETKPLVALIKQEISRILESGKHLLVSEEMFLVDSGKVLHQEKIERLAFLLAKLELEPVIILCARDPVGGLQSLYQELYRSLSLSQKIRFSSFVESNQAKVFDYKHLLDILQNAGLNRIRIIAFDELITGKLTYKDVFGPELALDKTIYLHKTNVGRYGASKAVREIGPIEFRDLFLIRSLIPPDVLSWLKKIRTVSLIWNQLAGRSLFNSTARQLKMPDEVARKFRTRLKCAQSELRP